MKPNVVLIVASLLTLLFMTFHMTHDVIRQAEGSVQYPIPVIVFVVWLYGTLMLSDRVGGYIIMLLGGLIGAGMIVVHSKGLVMRNAAGFFFIWSLFILSTTGWVTTALSIRGLWMKFRSRGASKLGSASGITTS
jgi:hypothetical protein